MKHFLPPKGDELQAPRGIDLGAIPEQPQFFWAMVESFDPTTGQCLISPLQTRGEMEAMVAYPCSMPQGVDNDGDAGLDPEYYGSVRKKYGKKDYRQAFGGMIWSLEPGTIAFVCDASYQSQGADDAVSLYVILFTMNLSQYEGVLGYPVHSANKDAPLGDALEDRHSRVRLGPKDFIDEVGYSTREREKMAQKHNVDGGEVLPLFVRPDVKWGYRLPARRKQRRQDYGYGRPAHTDASDFLDHPRVRFAGRERLDARRLRGKYFLAKNEVDVDSIEEVVSESVFHLDDSGRWLIASELEGTLVECMCLDENQYIEGAQDNGTYILMGQAAGIKFVEVSSADWVFFKMQRGMLRAQKELRTHAHSGAVRDPGALQTQLELFLNDDRDGLPEGTLYDMANMQVINASRLQIITEGIQLSCSPAHIFFPDGESLAKKLGS